MFFYSTALTETKIDDIIKLQLIKRRKGVYKMNLKLKFLSLIGTISLAAGAVLGNSSVCSAVDPDGICKVVFLGDAGVGETSIVERLRKKELIGIKPTVNVGINRVDLEGHTVSIWDTAGAESYHALAPMYLRNADIVVVVFDMKKAKDDIESVKANLEDWIKMLRSAGLKEEYWMLVGNKSDLLETVDDEAYVVNLMQDFLYSKRMEYFCEISAIKGKEIDNLESILNSLCDILKEENDSINIQEQSNYIDILSNTKRNTCCN